MSVNRMLTYTKAHVKLFNIKKTTLLERKHGHVFTEQTANAGLTPPDSCKHRLCPTGCFNHLLKNQYAVPL